MNQETSTTSPKVVAIISYLTAIGLVIAFLLNKPRSEFATFHIRQSLGLVLLGVAVQFLHIIPFTGTLLAIAGGIFLFVLWIIGLLGAIQEEKKAVPYLGEYFQDWFQGL